MQEALLVQTGKAFCMKVTSVTSVYQLAEPGVGTKQDGPVTVHRDWPEGARGLLYKTKIRD